MLVFLNSVLKEPPAKELLPWEEVYKTAETVLSSRNTEIHSSVDPGCDVPTENIYLACLCELLNKCPDSSTDAAADLYAFLNVRLWVCKR